MAREGAAGAAGAAGEGVTNAVNSITDGISSILKRLGDAVFKNIDPKTITDAVQKVDDSAVKITKYFGQGREHIQNIKTSMADAVISVNKLGGDFEDIVNLQESAAKNLGRNVVLASESYEKLYAAQQVVGEQNSSFLFDLKNVGISMYQATKQVEDVVNRAREIGVSAQAVTSEVSSNLDMLNKYTFKGGVDGLAKMAAQAVNMRINIRDISQTIDQAFNPESAIEMAASLQRLGVAQSDLLDPLKLMDLAQNDPAELQNQIAEMSKQFVQLNEKGQFEIMPGAKRQMMEIEKSLGMSQGSLAKMALSSAELGDKMSKIRFPEGAFSEEQKTFIANMAEMGEGGEYKITIDGKSMNLEDAMTKVQSMSAEDQKKFFEAQKPADITDLASQQLTISQQMDATLKSIENKLPYAVAGGKAAGTLMGGIKKESKGLADALDTELTSVKTMREKLNETTDGLSESFKDGKINFDKLQETAGNVGKYFNDILLEQLKNADKKLDGLFSTKDIVSPKTETKGAEDKTKTPTPTVQTKDFLMTPDKKIEFLPQDTIMGLTKGPEFLKTLEMMNKPVGGTAGGVVNENKNSHDITLTIKIDGGNVSEDKIMAVLNKTETIQTLNKKLKETMSNNGLTI